MNCAEIRPLLHAYADGELDVANSLELERHLKVCAGCAAEIKSLQSLRAAFQNSELAYRTPNPLRKEIRKIVRASAGGDRSHASQWIWKLIAAGATAFAVLTIFCGQRE